jgi:hypothetical protein
MCHGNSLLTLSRGIEILTIFWRVFTRDVTIYFMNFSSTASLTCSLRGLFPIPILEPQQVKGKIYNFKIIHTILLNYKIWSKGRLNCEYICKK